MKYAGRFGAGLIVGCLWAAAVQAQAAPPMFAAEAAASVHPLDAHEREARRLLKDAAAWSRFQVEAARLAASRSADANVRALATSLKTAHARAGDELLRLLHQRGLAAPMLENAQRKALTHLARLKGPKFDRDYLADVAAQARDEGAQCERAAPLVEDAAIGQWIARMQPVLRDQVQDAQRLAASHPAAAASPHRASRRTARRPGPHRAQRGE
jgi:putative membrane protein